MPKPTIQQYWRFVNQHWAKIRYLIEAYHPSIEQNQLVDPDMQPVVGPQTLKILDEYREDIRVLFREHPLGPSFDYNVVAMADYFLANKDSNLSMIIMETWIGLPSSPDAKGIVGYPELNHAFSIGLELFFGPD